MNVAVVVMVALVLVGIVAPVALLIWHVRCHRLYMRELATLRGCVVLGRASRIPDIELLGFEVDIARPPD